MRHHLRVHTILVVMIAIMESTLVRATLEKKHKNHRAHVNQTLYLDPCSAGKYDLHCVSGTLSLPGGDT
jgi:hypothetical protein